MIAKITEDKQAQVDIAKDMAILYYQEQCRSSNFRSLINHAVMASLDVESTADALLRNLETLIKYNVAELNIWSIEENRFNSYAVGNTSYTNAVGSYYLPTEGFTGWIFAHKKPLFQPNVTITDQIQPKSPSDFVCQSYVGVPLCIRVSDPEANKAEVAFLRQCEYCLLLMLPLVAQGNMIGVIKLLVKEEIIFQDDEISLAQALANQAAVALRNAQTFQQTDTQLQRRIREMNSLQRVGRELNSTLDLNTTIRLVAEEAVRATEADFGNVNLYDLYEDKMIEQVRVGWPDEFITQPYEINKVQGIIGRVLRQGKPEIVNDLSIDPDYLAYPVPAGSEMVVPIKQADVIVGIINIESYDSFAFTQNQLHYIEALAEQAAIAIRNAQAYTTQSKERRQAGLRVRQLNKFTEDLEQRVQERMEALQKALTDLRSERDRVDTLYNIARELSSSLDQDRVL